MTLDVATASLATGVPARLVSVEEVAKNYRIRVSYVYRLACRDQWRRISLSGRVYYDLDDVDASLGRD